MSTATSGSPEGRPVITAIITPTIRPVQHGDTLADTLSAMVTDSANYNSTEAAISTIETEWRVDGGSWTTLGSTVVSYGESIEARITVVDDQGNIEVFSGGSVKVAGIVPTLAISCNLDGQDLTINVDSLDGIPTPSVALTTLTLDGVDVLADENGTGSWVYIVPDSASSQIVVWEVTATNAVGPVTASGSETVPASQIAPSTVAAPSVSDAAPVSGETVTFAAGTYSGVPAPTVTRSLNFNGFDVTANMVGQEYTIPVSNSGTGSRTLIFTETVSNGVGDDLVETVQVAVAEAEITATVAPVLQPIVAGDTLNDSLTAEMLSSANYTSSAGDGSIDHVHGAWKIGGVWIGDGTTIVSAGQVIQDMRVIPTDALGNTDIVVGSGAPTTVTDTAFDLTATVDGEIEVDGTGDVSFTITSPAAYAGGPYTTDQSEEGSAGNLNLTAIEAAPQCIVAPVISVEADGTDTVGDIYTAVPGLWFYDAADAPVVAGEWYLDDVGTGETSLTYVSTAAGVVEYRESITGAGTTCTATSTGITVSAPSSALELVQSTTAENGAPFTAAAGANRMIVAVLHGFIGRNDKSATSDVTLSLGGAAFTTLGVNVLASTAGGRPGTAVFVLKEADIPATEETLAVTISGSDPLYIHRIDLHEFTGAAQSDPKNVSIVAPLSTNTSLYQTGTTAASGSIVLTSAVMNASVAGDADADGDMIEATSYAAGTGPNYVGSGSGYQAFSARGTAWAHTIDWGATSGLRSGVTLEIPEA